MAASGAVAHDNPAALGATPAFKPATVADMFDEVAHNSAAAAAAAAAAVSTPPALVVVYVSDGIVVATYRETAPARRVVVAGASVHDDTDLQATVAWLRAFLDRLRGQDSLARAPLFVCFETNSGPDTLMIAAQLDDAAYAPMRFWTARDGRFGFFLTTEKMEQAYRGAEVHMRDRTCTASGGAGWLGPAATRDTLRENMLAQQYVTLVPERRWAVRAVDAGESNRPRIGGDLVTSMVLCMHVLDEALHALEASGRAAE